MTRIALMRAGRVRHGGVHVRWIRGFPFSRRPSPHGVGGNLAGTCYGMPNHVPGENPAAMGEAGFSAAVGAVDGALQIRAVLEGTGQTVNRTVDPAPGPSIIDLPSPGC